MPLLYRTLQNSAKCAIINKLYAQIMGIFKYIYFLGGIDMKNDHHLWAAIIAGGQGTRLFPISHPCRPKQFCQLNDRNTFVQATIERFTSLGVKPTQILIVVTDDNQESLAKGQCIQRGVLSQNILKVSPKLG